MYFYAYVHAAGQAAAENEEEELDEDIAVTQSQTNFICPLTQVNVSIISHHQVHKMFAFVVVFCVLLVLQEETSKNVLSFKPFTVPCFDRLRWSIQ